MVRTKADAYTKVSVKATRKTSSLRVESSPSSSKAAGKVDKYAGGNPYCPRPTPSWQKPITNFFSKGATSTADCKNGETTPGCSKDPDCTSLDLDESKDVEPTPCSSKDIECTLEFDDSENVDPVENISKETSTDGKE